MTTTLASLGRVEEIVDEYKRQGFRSIFLRNLSPYGFAARSLIRRYDVDDWVAFYKRGLAHVLELNRRGYGAKPGATPLAHVQRLRTLREDAEKTLVVAGDDSELKGKADAAVAISDSERAKVPLLGADEAVVDDVLGVGTDHGANMMLVSLAGGVSVYRVHDALRRCMGIYVVGSRKGARAINGKDWTAARILSQAVGHSSTIKKPVGSATVTRWAEGPFPVVARWEGGDLVELRVGDAAP